MTSETRWYRRVREINGGPCTERVEITFDERGVVEVTKPIMHQMMTDLGWTLDELWGTATGSAFIHTTNPRNLD